MNRIINAARDSIPKGPPPPAGETASIKTFYEGPASNGQHMNWIEKKPTEIRDAVRRNYDKVAIQVYKSKDRSTRAKTIKGITPLKFHSLKIQSPFIMEACKGLFEEAGILCADNEHITFEEPFTVLYFARKEIERIQKTSEPRSDTYEHLKLLIDLMKDVFGDTATQVGKLVASKLMSFTHAWTLFPRGSIVYAEKWGHDRLYRVDNLWLAQDEQKKVVWNLRAEFIQFDGNKFGVSSEILTIPGFTGNRPIASMPVYPMAYYEGKGLRERLEKRGEKVLKFQDVHYYEYAGIAIPTTGVGKQNVNGRIIIDTISFSKRNAAYAISVGPLFGEKPLKPNQPDPLQQAYDVVQEVGVDLATATHQDMLSRMQAEAKIDGLNHLRRPTAEQKRANEARILKDSQWLSLVSPMLPGFSLKDKEWLHFAVDYVSEIPWDDEAFDHLVYSPEHKDLLLTFVKNHKDYGRETDDVITGKGQGLILLLSGPPGTGKTLTAEAVADRSRRPLYYLNVEELGTEPANLGGVLKGVLSLAIEWNAIVLLDEADVFLAKRSISELKRNELVSIFLRELEYYRGIMFLTTNLLQTIDDAFRSRIHIHLLYPKLSFTSRLTLWQSFIARLKPFSPFSSRNGLNGANGASLSARSSVTELDSAAEQPLSLSQADLEQLASWDLNGREIKNVVKTVRTWCACKGLAFDLQRLEVGIMVTAPFAKKIVGRE